MPKTGGLSPLPRESCSLEARPALLNFFLFFLNAHHQRGNSQPAHLRGISQSRTLHLACDVMAAARVPRPSWTAPSGRDSPSCRIPTARAPMTSPCTFKANLALRGVPHASTCALPVRNLRRTLCEQNTLRRRRRAVTHAPAWRTHPFRIRYPAYLLSVRGIS